MPSDYQNDALRSLSHDKTGGAESGGDELRKLWPTVPSDERKDEEMALRAWAKVESNVRVVLGALRTPPSPEDRALALTWYAGLEAAGRPTATPPAPEVTVTEDMVRDALMVGDLAYDAGTGHLRVLGEQHAVIRRDQLRDVANALTAALRGGDR